MTKEQITDFSNYELTKQLGDAILQRGDCGGSRAYAFGYMHAMIGGWMYELPELRAIVERELQNETKHQQ
jgi:hypothetical protein